MGFILFFHENIKFMSYESYDLVEMMSSTKNETNKGLHHTYISAILLVVTVIIEIENIDAFFCCRISSILSVGGR